MLQGLEEIREQDGFLHVRLRREEDFDPYIYEQIRMDEECLQPLQQQKHTFRYELGGLLSLSCFLEQYRFERAEGYCFLIQLLEHIVRVNRNKPVVMDVRYIYLPPQGNFFRFLCVPLNVMSMMRSILPVIFRRRRHMRSSGFWSAACMDRSFR